MDFVHRFLNTGVFYAFISEGVDIHFALNQGSGGVVKNAEFTLQPGPRLGIKHIVRLIRLLQLDLFHVSIIEVVFVH